MAFKRSKPSKVQYDSPEALFRDLRNRTVEGLLSHQADILRKYCSEANDKKDVAIELPTGSGKTLVGLLIAEFRRLVNKERVLYLCPTRQLVRQVVEQSEQKYGIKALAFTGKVKDFDPHIKSQYQRAETIAVSTYSALFNTNPFFKTPNLIILDDAHAAENYIGSTWSLEITRWENKSIYLGFIELLKDVISSQSYNKCIQDDSETVDRNWIEMLPSINLWEYMDKIITFLDANTKDNDLQYPWSFINNHLDACHLYYSYNSILIRPYIPPTLTHEPFEQAKQRIYMSATLGAGGDLERITGIKKLYRIPIPDGWDKQGIGRRFFIFPEESLPDYEISELILKMITKASRALILTPSDYIADEYRDMVDTKLGIPIFSARDIESSKKNFVSKPQAVAILANRYDGIDLIGDECRLLIIADLPKATNLQEKFLMRRMAASITFNDRIRTRIVQAIGRCTRSATDYAAICILGDDFYDWFILDEKRSLFHPELQGELIFGSEQSIKQTKEGFLENLSIFLKHESDWVEVDSDILEYRNNAKQKDMPGQIQLFSSAPKEVEYQYLMWNHDYEKATQTAQEVVTELSGGSETKGYRAFWYYLGGSSAWLTAKHLNKDVYLETAADLYQRASSCAPVIIWLRRLASTIIPSESTTQEATDDLSSLLTYNIEKIDFLFEDKKYAALPKFERDMKTLIDNLSDIKSSGFESAHVLLGQLLGYEADNSSLDAAPDPWWISNKRLCIVFEDKGYEDETNAIPPKYARQAASHHNWIKNHVDLDDDAEIITVMITNSKFIDKDSVSHAGNVIYWDHENFISWVHKVIGVLRKLRDQYTESGNLIWRSSAMAEFKSAKVDPKSQIEILKEKPYLRDLAQKK